LALLGFALAFYFLAQSPKYTGYDGLGPVGDAAMEVVPGPVHILGIGLIVVGVVVLNVASSP